PSTVSRGTVSGLTFDLPPEMAGNRMAGACEFDCGHRARADITGMRAAWIERTARGNCPGVGGRSGNGRQIRLAVLGAGERGEQAARIGVQGAFENILDRSVL